MCPFLATNRRAVLPFPRLLRRLHIQVSCSDESPSGVEVQGAAAAGSLGPAQECGNVNILLWSYQIFVYMDGVVRELQCLGEGWNCYVKMVVGLR